MKKAKKQKKSKIKNNLFLPALFDFVFLISSLVIFTSIQKRVVEHLSKIMEILKENVPNLENLAREQGFQNFTRMNEFMIHYNNIIHLIVALILLLLLVFILFEGTAWFLSFRFKKQRYLKFLYKFSLSSCFIFLILTFLFYSWISILSKNAGITDVLVSNSIINIIFTSILLTLTYFSLILFSSLKEQKLKEIFKSFTKNIKKQTLKAYCVFLLLSFFLFIFIFLVQKKSPLSAFILFFIVLPFILTYSRNLIIKEIK